MLSRTFIFVTLAAAFAAAQNPAKAVAAQAVAARKAVSAQADAAAANTAPASSVKAAAPAAKPAAPASSVKAATPAAKPAAPAMSVKAAAPAAKAAVPATSAKAAPAAKPAAPAPKTITMASKRDPFVSIIQTRTTEAPKCLKTGKGCLIIGEVVLKGIVKGPAGMLAVVENQQNKAYFLRENDPVFNGVVVRITPETVIFRERVVDRAGRDFSRDVVKRVGGNPAAEGATRLARAGGSPAARPSATVRR